MLHIYNNYEPR